MGYESLFTPFKIGNMEVKNRIGLSPMGTNSAFTNGRKDAQEIDYFIVTPMLLSAFVIDYRQQIIPNRLNLTMFEIGLIIAFLYGMSNVKRADRTRFYGRLS